MTINFATVLISVIALGMAFGSMPEDGTANMHGLKIDHVTVCGTELEVMQKAFASVGLEPDYGGPHANGVTHMALVGFEDGSYVELIAPHKPGLAAGSYWSKFMAGDAGPCAWAVETADIRADIATLQAAGIATRGPTTG